MWVDRRCGSESNGSLGGRIQRKKETLSLSRRGGFTSSKAAAERGSTGSALLYSFTEVNKLTRRTPTRALVILQSESELISSATPRKVAACRRWSA